MRTVLAWAVAAGHCERNAASEAEGGLPRNGHKTAHRAAIPYSDLSGALARIRASGPRSATSARLCVEFLALTGVRSSEARGARWSEVDLDARLWTVPAGRMKTRREHRVPLSAEALVVLSEARKLHHGAVVFPAPTSGGHSPPSRCAGSSFGRTCREPFTGSGRRSGHGAPTKVWSARSGKPYWRTSWAGSREPISAPTSWSGGAKSWRIGRVHRPVGVECEADGPDYPTW